MACYAEEDAWKCSKHPSKRRRNGICPICLRERLAVLCPNCAKVRPCACLASTLSSSFRRVIDGGEAPSSFNRSISVAIPFLRSRKEGEQAPSDDPHPKTPSFLSGLRRGGSKSKRFDKTVVGKNGDFVENLDRTNRIDDFAKMVTRSRSVSAGKTAAGLRCADVNSSPLKGKFWHFPSPMKAFRSPKAPKVAVQDRSPLHRG